MLPRLKTPLVDIVEAVIDERLSDIDIDWDKGACACVIIASGGFPEKYRKGFEITGLDDGGQADGVTIYHSGTLKKDGKFFTNGGRVLGVTASGSSLDEALEKAYGAVETISFEGAFHRSDIGRR